LLGIDLLRCRLLGTLGDPGEQTRTQHPAQLGLAQSPNWHVGRNGAIHLDDPAHGCNGGSGGVPLPLVLDSGQREVSDRIADFSHYPCAQFGRATGAAGAAEVGAAAPPPLNGGGCSTACHPDLSLVMAPASTFLSG